MANSGKYTRRGAQGKGTGTGANTETAGADIGENAVLSNRDKAQHSKQRGLDSKRVQSDQLRDTPANRGGE
jgi:hypothetical protein